MQTSIAHAVSNSIPSARARGGVALCVALVLAGAPLWLPAATQAREVHLQLHGLSVHAKERRVRDGQPYNGENWGVGLRLQTSGAVALQAGLYRNSFDRWSRYATCDWTPFPA
ncbi:MAG TPA: hypothetical protein VFR86_20550, partial [Burkholderiaceae bacterium]|nr:hypothetical protein [Burkholderiaceae bacterium]